MIIFETDAEATSADFHKIVALPNGALAFIGSYVPANSNRFAGVVLAVDPNGRLNWTGASGDANAHVLFQSGAYDATTNTVIAVGRVTAGGDDGTCHNWSQSFIQGFDASTGNLAAPQILGGPASSGPSSRRAFYDIAPTVSPRQYALIGFQSIQAESAQRCKDILQVGTLSLGPAAGDASRWSAMWTGRANGPPTGSEDGYALVSLGGNEYAVGGQIGDLAGTSLAHAVRFRLDPFAVQKTFNSPFPSLDAAQGAARFRAVTSYRD